LVLATRVEDTYSYKRKAKGRIGMETCDSDVNPKKKESRKKNSCKNSKL
jgi:hypothetical protein